MPHIPVLLKDVLSFFEGRHIRRFVDATLGAGGHSLAILQAHPEIEKFYAVDQDLNAHAIAKETLKEFASKVEFIHSNFDSLQKVISEEVDGILMDIGVSSMQLDTASRGFSFRNDGPLDMRMNQEEMLSAEELINRFPEREIAAIILEYGEERRAHKIAKAIVDARRKKKIETTRQLAEVIESVIPRYGKTDPSTTTFQALRIYINRELERLKLAIPQATSILAPEGRVAIITFHSLEDRIVKYAFREEPRLEIVTKKPIEATFEESKLNRRARSAKLRVAEKIKE